MSERLPSKASHVPDRRGEPVPSGVRYPGWNYLPVAAALPGRIRMIAIVGYAGVLSMLWATLESGSPTVFSLTIITQLGLMYFGFAFLLMNRTVARRDSGVMKTHSKFVRDFNMLTGRISGWSVFA
jgi:hypothetical protein